MRIISFIFIENYSFLKFYVLIAFDINEDSFVIMLLYFLYNDILFNNVLCNDILCDDIM